MTATTPLPAKLFNHYVIERVLGQGAMGIVYLARDDRDGKIIALKTISEAKATQNPMESMDLVRRMQREAELSKKLSHPNIVAFHEVGYENGSIAYLAMEFVDGESLEDKLKREGALPPAVVFQYATDLLGALAHAHGRGIVHRDFKPANILLTKTGHAKLCDFGIARPEESTMTIAGQVLGTPAYTSPENVMGGDVTPKTDLFSIGVVIYEMLTGTRPFPGKKMQEILVQLVTKPTPTLPMPEWDVVVQRLLKKAPEERFPTADAALDELKRSVRVPVPEAAPVVVAAPVAAAPPPPPPPPP
ncbi:MAG TPA: serine/threonine-protein kinase, partial [Thermoanaerobaculia bacterium]